VKVREKQSDSVITTVVTFGSRIHIHIAVIERKNDGMLSPRFVKRQARDKNKGIGRYGPKLVALAPANCIRRMSPETAYEGTVIHDNSREVVAKRMNLRCICAYMRRVVVREVEPGLSAALST